MPWQVVEKHEGYQVVKFPCQGGEPAKYFAKFRCGLVDWTPFRLTQQQASEEGQLVSAQITKRHQEDADVSWRATAVPELHNNPGGATAFAVQQAPMLDAPLGYELGSHQRRGWQHNRHLLSAVHAGAASRTVCAAGGTLTGGFVSLNKCYHGGLPGRCIQLGQPLGSGAFADVYQATILALNGLQLTNPQHHQQVMTAAAAAAGQPGSLVAVKVFRSSSSCASAGALPKHTAREVEALRHLRFKYEAVQLLAEGEPVIPASHASTASPAAASSPGPSSSSQRKRKFGQDPSSLQLPYCTVLELCAFSLEDSLRGGPCGELAAMFITGHVVELQDYCHSGKLGCIIVHRDLKPSNIMLRADGTVAVSDFGACHIVKLSGAEAAAAAAAKAPLAPLAAIKEEHSSQQFAQHLVPASTASSVWPDPALVATAAAAPLYTGIGTPFYCAPEVYGAGSTVAAPPSGQAAAPAAAAAAAAYAGGSCPGGSADRSGSSRRSYDASVDVFALGVVVVEMILGSSWLWEHGPPRSLAQVQQWEQRLQALVDGEVQLPEGVVVSEAALQFIGCCCGVGKERVAAAAARESPSASHLYS